MNINYTVENFRENPEHKIYGVTVGIVTGIADPENLGRIKVKFPHRDGDRQTDWVRVASLMAGPSRGILWLPEVNDEVLLAFNHGNIDEPYVIGALWNGKDKPPETAAVEQNKVKIRKIKTTRGHEVTFTDKANEDKLEVKTPAGNTVIMEDQGKKITVKDASGNNSIILDGQGRAITVQSGQKITLKASSCSIIVDGTAGITIDSGSLPLKIKGGPTEIKAAANLKAEGAIIDIKGQGPVSIGGAIVKIN